MQLAKQELNRFIGVNLREERLDISDIALAKAINADLHTFPGSIVIRYGRTKQFTSPLSSLQIRKLAKINSYRYQVAGTTVFRNQTSFLTGLSANNITTLNAFRPLNDATTWAFIADDAVMDKDNGTNTYRWGIAAPAFTPAIAQTATGGSLSAGAYSVKVTYIRKSGSSVAHESNPSTVSANQTVNALDRLTISGLTASSDPQVTHKRIYRTTAGGAVWLYDSEITDATTSVVLSMADTSLGAQVETDNNVPPTASWAFLHQEHMFFTRDALNPDYLWYSKRYRPESVPASNYLEIGNINDSLQCGLSIGGIAGVFGRLTKYRILGNSTSGFVAQEALSRRGTTSPNSVIPTEQGALFVARDGVFITNFMQADQNLSEKILPLFLGETVNGMSPINWTYANQISTASYKNRFYIAYPSGSSTTPDKMMVYSNDTQNWYFYDHPMRSLFYEEDLDHLTAGGLDGMVYILESGSSDYGIEVGADIAMEVETKDYFGTTADTRKLFRFFRIDANANGGTITAKFYIDGSLSHTESITGTRLKTLFSLPQACLGYSWRINLTYTGQLRPFIYGISASFLPLSGN